LRISNFNLKIDEGGRASEGRRRTRASSPICNFKFEIRNLQLLLLLAAIALSGCTRQDRINDVYGKRRSIDGADSVNGVGVLAEMFDRAGWRVSTWKRLSPKLEEAKAIVWAPDDFDPPSAEAREWLENWLEQEQGRTLVYIGRDYNAAVDYWRDVLPQAPPEQFHETARRLALAQSAHDEERVDMPAEQYARWFTARRNGAPRRVTDLSGPWSEGVDAAKTRITVQGVLDVASEDDTKKKTKPQTADDAGDPPFRQDVLLQAGEDVLVQAVSEPTWFDGEIIIVTNGSFLLNYPLVNHQHRILAHRLVEACGEPEKVYFLETGRFGVAVSDSEADSDYPTGLEMFTVWPLNAILLHLVALGILLLACLFPIFGRPRRLERSGASDFGRHIAALGDLLQRTREIGYATSRLAHYHQYVRRDSGKSHVAGAHPTRGAGARTELHVRIRLAGRGGPNPQEIAVRTNLERQLQERQVGEIVGLAAGKGMMDIVLLVADAEAAEAAIRNLLRELHLEERATIEQPAKT
jgi:hypothetical protein